MAPEDLHPNSVGDEYDEEADSDFDDQTDDAGSVSSSAEGEVVTGKQIRLPKKAVPVRPIIEELDSGDEVTIKERQKSKRKQKRRKDGQASSGDEQNDQWRAKTRSMRAQEQVEKQQKTMVSIRSSTVDVNKLWEEMNKPGPLPPVRIDGQPEETPAKQEESPKKEVHQMADAGGLQPEDIITIKMRYKFAGEVQLVEKVVPKSSAEATLWLAQQDNKKADSGNASGNSSASKQRPLRKISRFDPNYSNLEAFRNTSITAQLEAFKGPKLNVVEKSKMDWAAHVDKEGLKDELELHAKAKDAYMTRMDFLNEVGQRRDDEARAVRQKG